MLSTISYAKYLLTLSFSIFLMVKTYGQYTNFGIPFIENITKKEYEAGSQNWDILQDDRGVMFFANNDGLLQYNGLTWNTYPLPNRTIVRSIANGSGGKIYVGGQNELGYFFPNDQGDWSYRSLKHLVPANMVPFEDVWEVIVLNDTVYYQTANTVFQITGQSCKSFTKEGEQVKFLGKLEGRIYIQMSSSGLYCIQDDELKFVADFPGVFTFTPITGLFRLQKDTLLITTLLKGAYTLTSGEFEAWNDAYQAYFTKNRIYSTLKLQDGRMMIGTSYAGLLIVSASGEILQHIHEDNGLLNNKVLSLTEDAEGHLWLGSDNGINYLKVNAPYNRVFPDGNDRVAGFDVQEFNNKLYFATANGVFFITHKELSIPIQSPSFQFVENTYGQAWGLDLIGEELFLAHHSGSYLIQGNQAIKIDLSGNWGTWRFDHPLKQDSLLISGGYKGLMVYKREGNTWKFRNTVAPFNESSRFMVLEDENTCWVAHPYKAVYKLQIDPFYHSTSVTSYGKADGLHSDLHNHVFKVFNDLIFCSDKGVYKYDRLTDSFVPYDSYNQLFGENIEVKRLFEGIDEDIWYVTGNDFGWLQIEEKSLDKELVKISLSSAIREEFVGGFETICPIDEDNVFIGSYNGFIHFNPRFQAREVVNPRIFFDAVYTVAERDSLINSGLFMDKDHQLTVSNDSIYLFPYNRNGFRFSFSGDRYFNKDKLLFRYYLEGLDENWSEWSTNRQKEFTNLSPGSYVFRVRAMDDRNTESNELAFSFAITPPWYLSDFAKIIYVLGMIVSLGIFTFRIRQRFLIKDIQVSRSEQEIKELKQEKLEAEVEHKNRELVSTAIHLHHQNKLLASIKNRLNQILNENDGNKMKHNLSRVIKLVEIEEKSNDDWEKLQVHFNEIHTGFFDRLRKDFPELTRRDLRLAAYLRMNLSTKEIATLLNNTVRGVEGGRYRLRKKLGLDKNDSLSGFLSKY